MKKMMAALSVSFVNISLYSMQKENLGQVLRNRHASREQVEVTHMEQTESESKRNPASTEQLLKLRSLLIEQRDCELCLGRVSTVDAKILNLDKQIKEQQEKE